MCMNEDCTHAYTCNCLQQCARIVIDSVTTEGQKLLVFEVDRLSCKETNLLTARSGQVIKK
jgi:hypothetical protein